MIHAVKKILVVVALATGCASASAQKAEQPFLSVDGKMYYPRDFFNPYFEAYLKAEDKKAFTPESYIETFADDIVKINQAKAQGLDTLSSLREAVSTFTNLYTANYRYDAEAIERLAREAAGRAAEDIRVSVITVPVPQFAFAEDSLAARNRIDSIYSALKAGEPFDSLAVKINGHNGDLGFITAFQLPYALETAAYATPVGEFSEPVRTESAYYIVRPAERRPARGLASIAHVMIVRSDSDSLDRAGLAEIREAYARLKAGENFNKIVLNYTQDAATQANGGFVGVYGIGQLLPEIEDMVFALEPGQYTSIIATPASWEIIQLIEKDVPSDYDTHKDYLHRKVIADARYLPYQPALARSKVAQFPLQVDEKQYQAVVENLSNMGFLFGEWKSGFTGNASEKLFSLGDSTFTAGDFYNSLVFKLDNYGERSELRRIVRSKFDDFVADAALNLYVAQLPETDVKVKSAIEDFRNKYLIRSLVDGYAREQMENINPDTLSALYQRNPDKYMWKERVRYQAVVCTDLASAQKARQLMQEGRSYQEILSLLNKGIVTVADGFETVNFPESAFRSDFDLKPGVSDIIQEEENYFVFNLLEFIPPTRKTLEEATEDIRNDYLALCAERYPIQLRKAHDVQVFKKQLKPLAKAVAAQKKARGIQ